MTKDEARKLFSKEVEEISLQLFEKFKEYIELEQLNLIQKFITCFETYCNQIVEMQKEGKKGALGCIHFSWLRTNIISGNYQLRIDAYDKDWYSISTIYRHLPRNEQTNPLNRML